LEIIAKPHYLLVTRLLIDLFNRGELSNVAHLDVEPEYGYVGRIEYRNGAVRMFRGTNVGVNDNGATEISRDKGYTKYFLRNLHYHTAPAKVFLMPRYQELIHRNLSRYGFTTYPITEDIEAYVESIGGYPCFIKPNEESQGKGVYKCYDASDIQAALEEYERENIRTLIVEQNVSYVDYRVVVFDGAMIACYLRRPMSIVGDGQSTVEMLLQAKQRQLSVEGRPVIVKPEDPRLQKKLEREGLTFASIPESERTVNLYDISNLSTGGDAVDYTARIHPKWRDLCIEITQKMGLRLCGVDFACSDIESPDREYSIIETNAAPGLDNYAMMGETQMQIVRELYRRIFNEPPCR
jgi:D-alanine-D-alanine ligase-like ATP-grasp enzyme